MFSAVLCRGHLSCPGSPRQRTSAPSPAAEAFPFVSIAARLAASSPKRARSSSTPACSSPRFGTAICRKTALHPCASSADARCSPMPPCWIPSSAKMILAKALRKRMDHRQLIYIRKNALFRRPPRGLQHGRGLCAVGNKRGIGQMRRRKYIKRPAGTAQRRKRLVLAAARIAQRARAVCLQKHLQPMAQLGIIAGGYQKPLSSLKKAAS